MKVGIIVMAACLVGGLHCPSPEANVLAISKQLKEEEDRQKELDKINENLLFEQYKVVKELHKKLYKDASQYYKPHHKRGGSKYM